ncbi:MAG: hypothetical protein HOK52_14905 [Candidatus Marinimicrobia bacterium]|jgi:hypothetical protein|nr:hypothetical protein [Candidatus Neomarinimicrobiota bacterium]
MDDKITKSQLNVIEKSLDKIFDQLGVDVVFTKHFFDRLNDARNKKQITPDELVGIYKDLYKKFGKKISKVGGGKEVEELVKSMSTDINIPVHIEYDKKNKEVNLVAKTVMRKKGFKTGDKVLAVEGMLGFKDFIIEGQYEMMMRNGQVRKFIAKDDADAKRIGKGHNAKSVIRLVKGMPVKLKESVKTVDD